MDKDDLIERLAELEHAQWVYWSKSIAHEVSPERLERWKKYWVDYKDLPEDIKNMDRDWAMRVIDIIEDVREFHI
jgi:hypothetical protein